MLPYIDLVNNVKQGAIDVASLSDATPGRTGSASAEPVIGFRYCGEITMRREETIDRLPNGR